MKNVEKSFWLQNINGVYVVYYWNSNEKTEQNYFFAACSDLDNLCNYVFVNGK